MVGQRSRSWGRWLADVGLWVLHLALWAIVVVGLVVVVIVAAMTLDLVLRGAVR